MSATAQEGTRRGRRPVQARHEPRLCGDRRAARGSIPRASTCRPTSIRRSSIKNAGSRYADPRRSRSARSRSRRPQLSDLVARPHRPRDPPHPQRRRASTSSGELHREFHVDARSAAAGRRPTRRCPTSSSARDQQRQPARRPPRLAGRARRASRSTPTSSAGDLHDPAGDRARPVINGRATNGLRIGDVATVEDGHVEQRRSSRSSTAHPTLLLDVNRVITADEIKSTKIARDEIEKIEAEVPAGHVRRGRGAGRLHPGVAQRRAAEPDRGHRADRDRADALPARVAQRARS